jgi:hypothetical protein
LSSQVKRLREETDAEWRRDRSEETVGKRQWGRDRGEETERDSQRVRDKEKKQTGETEGRDRGEETEGKNREGGNTEGRDLTPKIRVVTEGEIQSTRDTGDRGDRQKAYRQGVIQRTRKNSMGDRGEDKEENIERTRDDEGTGGKLGTEINSKWETKAERQREIEENS